MKNNRKKRGLIAILAIFTLMLSVHAMAEIHFSDPSCYVGDEVTITFNVSEAFNSGQITLVFDADLLEPVYNNGQLAFVSNGLSSTANVSGNTIRIVSVGMDTDLHSVSYSLTMRAKKAGTALITVDASNTKFSDGSMNPITSGGHGSSAITISEKATQPPETNPPETNPPQTDPPAPSETNPPQTDPPHEHVYDVIVVVQENYRTSISSDGKYTIYWDQVRFDCACGEAHGDDLLDKENHREERETEPETTHAPSSEARLSALNFSGVGELSPAFNPDTYSYRLTVGGDVTGLNVRYSTKDENATAYFWPWIDGQMHDGEQKTIPYGETVFTIRVTAEDETTTRDYKVTIVRPEPETQPPETKKPEETTPEATTPEETTPEETTPEETTPEETTPE